MAKTCGDKGNGSSRLAALFPNPRRPNWPCMKPSISILRTVRESFAFIPAGLASSWRGALLFVLAGTGLSLAFARLGDSAPYLVATGALVLWCLWESQFYTTAPRKWPVPGKGFLALLASTLAFLPVLFFAIVLAMAVAAFFAGSVLAVLEIDPDTLNWAEDPLEKNLQLLGQEGVAVVVLSTIAAFLVPFAVFVRTAAFRPVSVRERRFVVFEPGGWSRGSTWSLILAGAITILLPLSLSVFVSSSRLLDGGLLMLLCGWAVLALALLSVAGFCRSVLSQSRPVS